ncbi:hypothetical protein EVA_13373 [gut metagenome]|uniref:Uncharacterized protein n=1 Tax=gut metagenome TaxID=749906 RepID=J9CEU2_9ZZZZ
MVPGMGSDLTADLFHPLHSVRIQLHILSLHKEGRVGIVRFQTIQKLRGILCRSVIKGQGQTGLDLLRVISSILIKIEVLHALTYPASLKVAVVIKVIGRAINILKAGGIEGIVCILIPPSVFVLVPAWGQFCGLGHITLSKNRLPDGGVWIRLWGLDLNRGGFGRFLSSNGSYNGEDHSPNHKYKKQNGSYSHHHQTGDPADHHLSFFSRLSLA